MADVTARRWLDRVCPGEGGRLTARGLWMTTPWCEPPGCSIRTRPDESRTRAGSTWVPGDAVLAAGGDAARRRPRRRTRSRDPALPVRVVVADGVVATNLHVVARQPMITISTVDGATYRVGSPARARASVTGSQRFPSHAATQESTGSRCLPRLLSARCRHPAARPAGRGLESGSRSTRRCSSRPPPR
jgi:hypothetical protein